MLWLMMKLTTKTINLFYTAGKQLSIFDTIFQPHYCLKLIQLDFILFLESKGASAVWYLSCQQTASAFWNLSCPQTVKALTSLGSVLQAPHIYLLFYEMQ